MRAATKSSLGKCVWLENFKFSTFTNKPPHHSVPGSVGAKASDGGEERGSGKFIGKVNK